MKLLALETSSMRASVALAAGAELREIQIETPREQTAQILPAIERLLAEAGWSLEALDAIVFGRGPGSFTGLRVAAAVAQGLALATERPLVGVSSLEALAQRAYQEHGVQRALTCVDARMHEVYWAAFQIDAVGATRLGPEQVGAPERVAAPEVSPWSALGDGFRAHAEALQQVSAGAEQVLADLIPRARDLLPRARLEARAGRFLAAAAALPSYLRDGTAWKPHSA